MTIDKTKAKEILVNELNYKDFEADSILEEVSKISNVFAPVMQKWLDDRSVSDFLIEGISIKDVMNSHNCDVVRAAIEMNFLLDPNITPENKQIIIRNLKEDHIFV